jgi:hypothetical protein
MKADAVYAGDEFPSKGLVYDKAKNEGERISGLCAAIY